LERKVAIILILPNSAERPTMKLAILGYGRMGRAVEEIARERGHEVTAIIDIDVNEEGKGITAATLKGAEVAIDFSTSEAVLPNVRSCARLGVGIVVGTTGWEAARRDVEDAVRSTGSALLHSPNFSVGMLFFMRLVEQAARLVNRLDEFDVHLAETHHRHKKDHPGGTARRLAEILVNEIDRKGSWSTALTEGIPVDPGVLQLSVARVGEVPGIHEVGIESADDSILLRHEARGRKGFARGAVFGAEWLRGKAGIYTMEELMEDIFNGSTQ
jgi:4-hydroxy-tetrahydrodipicolinate reductase